MALDLQGDILLRDRATGTLRDVERGVDRLSQSVNEMSRRAPTTGRGGILGDLLGSGAIAGGIAGLAAGLGAREVARFGSQMDELATASLNAESALTGFAGGAGEASERVRAIQEASGGAVSRLEAMTIANKGATLGFGETSQELSRVTDLAARVATVFGGEVTPTIDNMAAAAANLSFVRLDTLGISADETRARFEELREELGDTEAFMQAMLEVGEETFIDVEPQVSSMTKLRSSWADYQQFLAREAQPTIERTTEIMNEALPRMEGHARVSKLLEEATFDMSSAFRDFRGELAEIDWLFVTGQVEEANKRFAELKIEVEAAMRATDAMPSSLDAMGFSIAGVTDNVAGLNSELRALQILAGQIDPADLTPGEQMTMGAPDPMFADPGTGPSIGEVMADWREDRREEIEAQIRNNLQTTREQQRLNERTAREAQRAWEAAAREAEREWKDAISGIPGLPGGAASPVTEQQMALAEAGIPQQFADDFLRQARDELVNGIDRANIDRAMIEALVSESTGFDVGGLGGELLADLLEEEFTSGRLFGTEMAQAMAEQLINLEAVRAEMQAQEQAEAGLSFVDQLLRSQFGGPQVAGTGTGQAAGEQAVAGMNIPGALEDSLQGQDLATPMATALQNQWAGDDFLEDVSGIGARWIQSSLQGAVSYVEDGPPEMEALAASLLAQLLAAINGED